MSEKKNGQHEEAQPSTLRRAEPDEEPPPPYSSLRSPYPDQAAQGMYRHSGAAEQYQPHGVTYPEDTGPTHMPPPIMCYQGQQSMELPAEQSAPRVVICNQPSVLYNFAPAMTGPVNGCQPPPDHFRMAFLATVCCFFPTGFYALIKVSEARYLAAAGDMRAAEARAKEAYKFIKCSIGIGIGIMFVCGFLIINKIFKLSIVKFN